MKVHTLLWFGLLLSACQPHAPTAKPSNKGLCPTDRSGLVTEDHLAVPAWQATLVSCAYGPAEAEVPDATLYLQEAGQPVRRLAVGLVGTLHPLPMAKQLFSCQDNGASQTTAPLLVGLEGKSVALLPHAGLLRACTVVGSGEQVLVQYDLDVPQGAPPASLVRVYDADAALLIEQRFEHEGRIAFSVGGKPYEAEVLEPAEPD